MEKQDRFPEGEAPLKNTDNAYVRVENTRVQKDPSSGEEREDPAGGTSEREERSVRNGQDAGGQ